MDDMDLQVSALTPFGLARGLPLGDVRPKWASSVQPWWDLDCDRDLLLGTFLHGFGAYPKMKADPRLCFTAKVGGGRGGWWSGRNAPVFLLPPLGSGYPHSCVVCGVVGGVVCVCACGSVSSQSKFVAWCVRAFLSP